MRSASSSFLRRTSVSAAVILGLGIFAAAAGTPAGCARATPCRFNSDCIQAYCSNGDCKQDCVDSERDCPRGSFCNDNAQCETSEPSGSSSGSGGSAASSSSSGGQTGGAGPGASSSTSATSTSAASTSASASSSASSGGQVGNKVMLDPCGSDAECVASLICRPLTRNGEKRCTPTCVNNTVCPSGTRCLTVDGTQFCAGDDTGRTCNDPTPCNFGCLTGPGYCTAPCSSGAMCPNGYGCSQVGNPPTSVCVKAEAYCTAQNTTACIVPAACDTSPGQLLVGACTLACNTAADCPQRATPLAPWTCNGLCKRPGDVYGPLAGGQGAQYACNAAKQVVSLCNDAQHIDFTAFTVPAPPAVNCNLGTATPGVAGDSCVDSCRYQGGCTYGSACVAVGGIGNARIGLCLPTGAGEVGTACATDAQCAFGYCNKGKCSRDCTQDGVCPTGSTCVAGGGPLVDGFAFRRCE